MKKKASNQIIERGSDSIRSEKALKVDPAKGAHCYELFIQTLAWFFQSCFCHHHWRSDDLGDFLSGSSFRTGEGQSDAQEYRPGWRNSVSHTASTSAGRADAFEGLLAEAKLVSARALLVPSRISRHRNLSSAL
ncbi:hypothetical protein [Nitrobacter winogradskyi]|uniref:Uncharacterized protein n=1 Tax=Nitrobacter winogradskyi TaxID=913 RepID=A0ACC6AHZ4_NITWI|nr:hypothetical protein [Nitrobacter winogradskyi]MCP1999132.1 hypothetical protein [Nitrobacter winogradskyi]